MSVSLPPDSSVFSLLQLVSDSTAAKQRLEEITKANMEFTRSVELNRELSLKTEKDKKEAEQAWIKAKQEHQDYLESVSSSKDSLSNKHKELDEKIQHINKTVAEANQRLNQVQRKEIELNVRESQLNLREISISKREDSVSLREHNTLQTEEKYNKQINLLKDIVNA